MEQTDVITTDFSDIEHIGKFLKSVRESVNLSQTQLADRLDMKKSNISQFERTESIAVKRVQKLLKAMKPNAKIIIVA